MKSIQNPQPGCPVQICAGRDKDSVMVVLAADESFVYVADGKHRKVQSPKRKKAVHLRILEGDLGEISRKISQGIAVSDSALRKALYRYRTQYQFGN